MDDIQQNENVPMEDIFVLTLVTIVSVIIWKVLGWFQQPKEIIAINEDEKKKVNQKSNVLDIEDLIGKSLIPSTLRNMKTNDVKPLTHQEKTQKVDELESLSDIPNFAAFLRRKNIEIPRLKTVVFQLNIGYYCNQACSHCHVDSSPLRKDMMNKDVADKCLDIIRKSPSVKIVDLTGGAPELNRQFKYLVEQVRKLGLEIIDRCNLTVLLEPHQAHLPQFLADNKVRIIASLPCYLEDNVDKQRGDQIFMRSIKGLQLLNAVGYGKEGSGLMLNLVYNPTGIHLPPAKEKLQADYKRELKNRYNIEFTELICITNMPLNRFYDHLKAENNLERYMHLLVDNFNDAACEGLMCKTYVSIDPSGQIFDCDFNQQLDMGLDKGSKKNLSVFDIETTDDLMDIPIVTKKHCYGCSAGAGSSCGAL